MTHILIHALLILISTYPAAESAMNQTSTSKFPSLDGCRYVFLDLGANIGMHTRFLFESHLYPKQEYKSKILDAYFPKDITNANKGRGDVCSVGFEPNTAHKSRLQLLSAYYKSQGVRAYWVFAGVSNTTGRRTFATSKLISDIEHNQWGMHTVPEVSPSSAAGFVRSSRMTMHQLDIVRLVDIFRTHIQSRVIPAALRPEDPPPAVVMKVDIEGEEYSVLQDMLGAAERPLCHVAAFSIEFHKMRESGEQKPVLDPLKERASRDVMRAVEVYKQESGCAVNMVMYDTEEHFNDNPAGRFKLAEWCSRGGAGSDGGGIPKLALQTGVWKGCSLLKRTANRGGSGRQRLFTQQKQKKQP